MIHAFRLSHYDTGTLIPTPHEGPRTHGLAGPLEGHAVFLDNAVVPGGAMAVVYMPPGCALDVDERREAIVEAVRACDATTEVAL